MGAEGAAGSGGETRIVASIFCQGVLENAPLAMTYEAIQFSSGFVFSSAAIRGVLLQVSGATIFDPTQNGWATAPVYMTYDAVGADNAGWWKVSLDRQTLIVTAECNDPDLTGGTRSWFMTPDKCVSNTY